MSLYKIRKAQLSDIKSVYDIERESIRSWTADQFIHELENSFSLFLVAEIKNSITGYIIAWKVADEIQLNNIAVKNSCRRTGIATKLLTELYQENQNRKYSKIYLEVKSRNYEAISFYVKNGFIRTGIRKNYYANDDAILMEKTI